jgi:nucleoside-diphosphate-sugar epimerase
VSDAARYETLAGKRFLVTGAAGFIGGSLLRGLAGSGLDAVGTAMLGTEVDALRAEGFAAERLDLADPGGWEALLEGVDVVFNVAAMFQDYDQGEEAYDRVNHLGALELARCSAAVGVKRFVQCSTVGVHGHVKEVPATERTPFNPMDAYHRTKLAGELAILDFGRTLPPDGMVVTVNRPAMVYGPRDTRMLKLFKAIATRRFRMIGSGNCLAHLGYIDDQTESFLLQAAAPRERVHLEAFNVASDRPTTLNELTSMIAESAQVSLARIHVPLAPVWVAALLCEAACRPFGWRPPLFRRRVGFFTHDRAFDLTKAREHLGYESRWPHSAGIAATLAWYREQGWIPASPERGVA